ncbi:hypothetical protein C0J52_20030 [Blattella germanica]|nr:hypothetical protein C0J52_20030 [Blattella germanica]
MQFCKFTHSAFLAVGVMLFLAPSIQGEHNYELIITRLEKPKVDAKWASAKAIKVTKVNATSTTLTGQIELLKDLPTDNTFECAMVAYNSVGGGQYKRSAVSFGPTPVCEFIQKDDFAYPSLLLASNLPTKCPFKKVS